MVLLGLILVAIPTKDIVAPKMASENKRTARRPFVLNVHADATRKIANKTGIVQAVSVREGETLIGAAEEASFCSAGVSDNLASFLKSSGIPSYAALDARDRIDVIPLGSRQV